MGYFDGWFKLRVETSVPGGAGAALLHAKKK